MCVELQIPRFMRNTHIESNGMDETIIVNGTDVNDELLDEVSFVDDVADLPIKRTKLAAPAFMKKQPVRVTWRPIEPPKPVIDQLGIESICPNICFFFLRDECIEGENCYYSHELPSDTEVRRSLANCGVEDAAKLLTVVIARCAKLLQQYFSAFVTYFAEEKAKAQLIEAIAICQRESNKERQFQYFQQLFKAFIRIDVPYSAVMQIVFWHLDSYNKQKDVVDSLLNMSIVDGIGVSDFLSVFDALDKERFPFHECTINRLMFLCTKSERLLSVELLADFCRLIFKILRKNTRRQLMNGLNKECYENYLDLYRRMRRRL